MSPSFHGSKTTGKPGTCRTTGCLGDARRPPSRGSAPAAAVPATLGGPGRRRPDESPTTPLGKGPAAMSTTTTGLILALDLGKYKSVACLYPPGSGRGIGRAASRGLLGADFEP